MKKLLFVLTFVIGGILNTFALSPTYKGFADIYTGYSAPSNTEVYGGGVNFGFSTSHGVTLLPGLFVGAGVDLNLSLYEDKYSTGSYYDSDLDCSALLAFFAEGRYSFLHSRKVSPFVGVRIGGGYNGYDEGGCFYFSPSAGCTINITKRFGLDASIGYGLYTGEGPEPGYNDHFGNINCVTFNFGVHF